MAQDLRVPSFSYVAVTWAHIFTKDLEVIDACFFDNSRYLYNKPDSFAATNGSIWVAEDKGLFRKHGIDVEVIVVGGGGARVVSALVAGDLHFSVGGGEGSVRSQLRGADTVIAASSLSKGLQRIMARSEIKSYQRPQNRHHPIWLGGASRSSVDAQEVAHGNRPSSDSPGRLLSRDARKPRQRRN